MPAAVRAAEQGPSAARSPTPVILSTDLSLDRDPDDWFDTLIFLTLPGIEPRGVVLEHYATDEVLAETQRLLRMLGGSGVPVAKGARGPLQRDGHKMTAPPHHAGVELILSELRRSTRRVTLIAVGALTNEALAYHRDPELFRRRVAAIHFVGGNLSGRRDMNANRDPLAVQVIFDSPLPVVWTPCSNFHKQKLTGEQEREIAAMERPAADFLTDMLLRWRKARPDAWLQRTEQLPHQGKNLWSLPALLDAAGSDVGRLDWVSGRARFDFERWTWFETDPTGPDRMLMQRDAGEICEWLVRYLRSGTP